MGEKQRKQEQAWCQKEWKQDMPLTVKREVSGR